MSRTLSRSGVMIYPLIAFAASAYIPLWIRLMRVIVRKSMKRICGIPDKKEDYHESEIDVVRESRVARNIFSLGQMEEEGNQAPVEVLLHNISHIDLVLSVANHEMEFCGDDIIARPKFGYFHDVTTRIHDRIVNQTQRPLSVICHPVFSRQSKARRPIDRSQINDQELPVGFDISRCDVIIENSKQLRFRDSVTADLAGSNRCKIYAVYFPLLAVVVRKWLDHIDGKHTKGRKVLFLISGQGTPRNEAARVQDNSTEVTAKLMKLFVEKEYPMVDVQLVHSEGNLFRYDANIVFVRSDLLPRVDSIRNDLASRLGAKWAEKLRLTISFADGSSARISAINAALRQYRPSYMHFWQLKTFWHETKVCHDDIEYHSYHEIETIAPTNIKSLDHATKLVVEEMLNFKSKFEQIKKLSPEEHDMAAFWLRKTRKPVLAVILTQKFGTSEPPKLYCGTNMEVSMPTGSLCAERNVIGSALAADLTLRRQDIKIIAVLSLSLESTGDLSDQDTVDLPSSAELNCTACSSATNTVCSSPTRRSTGSIDLCKESSLASHDESVLHPPPEEASFLSPPGTPDRPTLAKTSSQSSVGSVKRTVNVFDVPSPRQTQKTISSDDKIRSISKHSKQNQDKLRKLASLSLTDAEPPKRKIEVDHSDMNPLKPCGACLEWLKKIAEVNPSLSVVTFTDANCNGVYVEEISL